MRKIRLKEVSYVATYLGVKEDGKTLEYFEIESREKLTLSQLKKKLDEHDVRYINGSLDVKRVVKRSYLTEEEYNYLVPQYIGDMEKDHFHKLLEDEPHLPLIIENPQYELGVYSSLTGYKLIRVDPEKCDNPLFIKEIIVPTSIYCDIMSRDMEGGYVENDTTRNDETSDR